MWECLGREWVGDRHDILFARSGSSVRNALPWLDNGGRFAGHNGVSFVLGDFDSNHEITEEVTVMRVTQVEVRERERGARASLRCVEERDVRPKCGSLCERVKITDGAPRVVLITGLLIAAVSAGLSRRATRNRSAK